MKREANSCKSGCGSEIWYEYDNRGNLIYEKMSNGYEDRHAYDDAGNEIYRKSYDETETSYEYNADGCVQYEKTLDEDGTVVEKFYEYRYHENSAVKEQIEWETY